MRRTDGRSEGGIEEGRASFACVGRNLTQKERSTMRGTLASAAANFLGRRFISLSPALFSGSQNSCHVGSYHFPHLVPAASLLKVAGSRYAVSPRAARAVGAVRVRVRTRVGVARASLALMNRVSNRPFSLQVVSQAEGSACCMDGSGRGTAMICLPVVNFNDGQIDGRLNAAASATTLHALPRKTSEVGLSLILQLLRARTPPAGRGPFHS